MVEFADTMLPIENVSTIKCYIKYQSLLVAENGKLAYQGIIEKVTPAMTVSGLSCPTNKYFPGVSSLVSNEKSTVSSSHLPKHYPILPKSFLVETRSIP